MRAQTNRRGAAWLAAAIILAVSPATASAQQAAAATPQTVAEDLARLRAARAEVQNAGDEASERRVLEQLYLTGFASEAEIDALRQRVESEPSTDAARDEYLAYMATTADHLDLAAALYESIDRGGGLESWRRAVMLTNLATLYLEMGDSSAALSAAERATFADPSYMNAWGLRGMLLDSMGMGADALPVLERAYLLGARQPELVARLRALRASYD